MLRYRTWIGGDRDGNPNVTAEVTRRTMAMMRGAAVERWLAELAHLRHVLSVSTSRADLGREIHDAIEQDHAWIDAQTHLDQRKHEPLRVRLSQMRARIERDETYSGHALLEDLMIIRRALHHAGLGRIGEEGLLADAIIRARVFGLHLATIDIRQHSEVHERAAAELLSLAGVQADYTSLDEAARLALLRRELGNPRPLTPVGAELSHETAEVLATMGVVRDSIDREPETCAPGVSP